MKITKSKLKQIIQEELGRVMSEASGKYADFYRGEGTFERVSCREHSCHYAA